jgi:hypothetical protein
MARRDPHVILGVERGADATRIKAAWRRLARANHPDLTGDDPAASRIATRRMAEINEAYAALTRDGARGSATSQGSPADLRTDGRRRPGGPPPPRPTRPVTGRVDTTATYRARNQTTAGGRATLSGNPPLRGERVRQEAPRASTPTGPLERDRVRNFRRPKPPRLDVARRALIDFGKFHGHTLGEIAAFEPSYIDWVAGTVKRDPELVAAARVVQADLDARGIARRAHPAPVRPSRSA